MFRLSSLHSVPSPAARLGLWLAAYFLAYQGEIRIETSPPAAAALYTTAIGLGMFAALSNWKTKTAFSFPHTDSQTQPRYLWLIPSLSLAAYLFYTERTSPITGVVSGKLWLLSLAALVLPFIPFHFLNRSFGLRQYSHWTDWLRSRPRVWWFRIILFSFLMAIALAYRLPYLERFPVAIHNDEANCGLAARTILDEWRKGAVRWFRPSDFLQYHTLGFIPSALFQAWFPPNLFGHRLANVALSMAALCCFYLLLRDLLGYAAARIGLGLAACAHTAVHWSRSGIHSGHATFLTVICAWLLWKGIQTGRMVWFVWLGFGIGCSLITYQAAFLIPGWLGLVATLMWLIHPEFRRRYTVPLIITLLAFVVFMAPTFATWYKAPELFFTRQNSMIFSRNEDTIRHLSSIYGMNYFPGLLWHNFKRTFLLFNCYGDTNFQYGYNLGGMVDDYTAPALVLGLIVAIADITQWNIRPLVLGILLCWGIGAGLTLDSTQYSRVAGMAFLIFTLPALWGSELIQSARDAWGKRGVILAGIGISVAVLWIGWINFELYFIQFDRAQNWGKGAIISTIALDARDDGPHNATYILDNTDLPTNFRHQTLLFVAAERQFESFNDAETVELPDDKSLKTVTFIVPANRQYDLRILRRRFPFGKLESRMLSFHPPASLYSRYIVPPAVYCPSGNSP